MLIAQIFAVVVIATALAHLVLRAVNTSGIIQRASERLPLVASLLNCSQCVCFWSALACQVPLWILQEGSLLDFGLCTLIGWRGAYYINRQIERHSKKTNEKSKPATHCEFCEKLLGEDSLDRRGVFFCSMTCWFDFLKHRPPASSKLFTPKGQIIRQEVYPVSYKDTNSQKAQELMQNQDYKYIDVRSEPEFLNGHPDGALNIPIMHREQFGMVPNTNFLVVMEANFERDDKLLIGCQSGGRSARAAELLIAAGFTDVANVNGGFGGARAENGELIEKGWLECGLPVAYGEQEGRNYSDLGGTRR